MTHPERCCQIKKHLLYNNIQAFHIIDITNPFYDSNIFSSDDSATEYSKLLNDKTKPLINRIFDNSV